ncbi:MAG: YdcF family protein [Pseudomonadales bacterium]|nr:YdcF family protein [Pseudomonadales bacterium]
MPQSNPKNGDDRSRNHRFRAGSSPWHRDAPAAARAAMMRLWQRVKWLLLPPGLNLLLVSIGLLLWPGWPIDGLLLVALSLLLLLLFSSGSIVRRWQRRWSLPTRLAGAGAARPPAAIVILGAGRRHRRSGDCLTRLGIERLHRGAALARSSGLPLLLSGGRAGAASSQPSEAALMQDYLVQQLGLTPQWLEQQSRTTWENARMSTPLLADQQIDAIYLVSHGWHLRRACLAFAQDGMMIWPVAVEPRAVEVQALRSGWPSRTALRLSLYLLHELLGYLWYRRLARRYSAAASVVRPTPSSGQSPKR